MQSNVSRSFNSRCAKLVRSMFIACLPVFTLAACGQGNVRDDGSMGLHEWNKEAHRLQQKDERRRQRYAEAGKNLQRRYLMRQYHACKKKENAGKPVSETCDKTIRKVEGAPFRY